MSTSAGDLDVTLSAITAEFDAAMKGAMDAMEKFGVSSTEVSTTLAGLGASAEKSATSLETLFRGLGDTTAHEKFRAEVDAEVASMKAAEDAGKAAGDAIRNQASGLTSTSEEHKTLTERLKDYRSEEVKAGREARFFANELSELTGMSSGTAGALAKIGVAMTEGPFGVGVELAKLAVGKLAEHITEAIAEAAKLDKQKFDNIANALTKLRDGAQSAKDKFSAMLGMDVEGMGLQRAYDSARSSLDAFMSDHAELAEIPREQLEAFSENAVGTVSTWGYISSAQAAAFIEMTDKTNEASKALDDYRSTQAAIAKQKAWENQIKETEEYNTKLKETRALIKGAHEEIAKKAKTADAFNFSGESGKTPMNVMSDTSIDEMTHRYVSADSEKAQSEAMDEYGRVSLAASKASQKASDDIDKAAAQLGNSVLSSMGDAGDMINAAMQGASAGPIGAAVAAVLALLMKAPAFGDMVQMINDIVGELVMALNPVLEALKPLLGIAAGLVSLVIDLLEPALQAIAVVIQYIANAIGSVVNTVLDIVADVLDWVPGAGKAAKKVRAKKMNVDWDADWSMNDRQKVPDTSGADRIKKEHDAVFKSIEDEMKLVAAGMADHSEGESVIKSAKRAAVLSGDAAFQEQINSLTKQLEAMLPADVVKAPKDLADNLNEAGDAVADVAESLSNVPSGYKVALARFNATDFGQMTPALAGATAGGGSTVIDQAPRIEVHNMTVQAPTAEVAAAVVETLKRNNVIRTGSSLTTTSPYVGGRKTQER